MLKHATLITVIGFILLIIGVTTLFSTLVGVDIAPLAWLYAKSPALSYAIRLAFIVIGLVMIYVGRVDWDQERI